MKLNKKLNFGWLRELVIKFSRVLLCFWKGDPGPQGPPGDAVSAYLMFSSWIKFYKASFFGRFYCCFWSTSVPGKITKVVYTICQNWLTRSTSPQKLIECIRSAKQRTLTSFVICSSVSLTDIRHYIPLTILVWGLYCKLQAVFFFPLQFMT